MLGAIFGADEKDADQHEKGKSGDCQVVKNHDGLPHGYFIRG